MCIPRDTHLKNFEVNAYGFFIIFGHVCDTYYRIRLWHETSGFAKIFLFLFFDFNSNNLSKTASIRRVLSKSNIQTHQESYDAFQDA